MVQPPFLSKYITVWRQFYSRHPTRSQGYQRIRPTSPYALPKLASSRCSSRFLSSSSSKKGAQEQKSVTTANKGEWKRNGTPELIIGVTVFSLIGIDQFLQYTQKKNRENMLQELRLAVHEDTLNNNDQDMRQSDSDPLPSSSALKEKEALFTCIIRRIPKLFDGTKSLMNVHVGDLVDILEENVGPDGMYHFCRVKKSSREGQKGNGYAYDDENDRSNQYIKAGWFPISCLEKESN